VGVGTDDDGGGDGAEAGLALKRGGGFVDELVEPAVVLGESRVWSRTVAASRRASRRVMPTGGSSRSSTEPTASPRRERKTSPRRVRAVNDATGTAVGLTLIDARPKRSASKLRGAE
jgi:hypothetical protein